MRNRRMLALVAVILAGGLAFLVGVASSVSTQSRAQRVRNKVRSLLLVVLPGRCYSYALLTFSLRRPPRPTSPTAHGDLLARTLLGDPTPLQVHTTDKVAMAAWVAEQLGDAALPHRLAVAATLDEIDLGQLPDVVVVKASHGSGMSAFIRPPGTGATVRDDRAILLDGPPHAARQRLHAITSAWLATDYSTVSREPQYRGIPPRIIVEEDLGAGGDDVIDVSFTCVAGRVVCARIRDASGAEHHVDEARRSLAVTSYQRKRARGPIPVPHVHFATMVGMATTLARPFDIVRVDFYLVGDRILVSELTHTPQGGKVWYHPRSFGDVVGSFWRGETSIPARFYADPADATTDHR